MKYGRRMIVSILWIVLGVVLLGCAIAGLVDAFWSGMGGALLAVGVLQLVRYTRYQTSADYRDKVDTERKDERNRFLNGRAWAWAGYLYVIIAAVATIALKLAGQETLMMMASGSLCLLLVLYWFSYLILRKKY